MGHGHLELVTLAAHGLDEDGQVHLTAARYQEALAAVAVGYTQGYILEQFALQTVTQMTGGDKLAITTGERGCC